MMLKRLNEVDLLTSSSRQTINKLTYVDLIGFLLQGGYVMEDLSLT
jgi:hypothetical protein